MEAISSYGQAYDIIDIAVDVLATSYGVLNNVSLLTDKDSNKVKIDVSKGQSYQGFTSMAGDTGFRAPRTWAAEHIEFKYQSEHTVNDKRMDFEMQIFHKVYTGEVPASA